MYSRRMTPCIALAMTALLPSIALAGGDVGFEFDLHGYYIIDFVVFFGALIYFGRRPIAAMLDQRHKTVAAEMRRQYEAAGITTFICRFAFGDLSCRNP